MSYKTSFAQKKDFLIHNIALPPEMGYYDNQFSGLYIHAKKLFFLSESRLQDSAEGKLYAVKLIDLKRKVQDTGYALPYQKYQLHNLGVLRKKMAVAGDEYEGLEAVVIAHSNIYFSVETATASNNCYLLKGRLSDTAVILYPDFLIPMPKPVNAAGKHIYNAGFEAMAYINKSIFPFFEYNYFGNGNNVKKLTERPFKHREKTHVSSMQNLPFRITDITQTGAGHFTAINYFYKGGGADTIYRVPISDTANDKLIRDENGYKNYCRLIDIRMNDLGFSWKSLWEFPSPYSSFNWEGLAAYNKGYFVMNDKYTAARPYVSTLLFLEKK